MPNQSDILKQQLFKSLALPWQDILPESRIETILEEEEIRYRKQLYSPMVTLWAMVYQVLCEKQKFAQHGQMASPMVDCSGRNTSILRHRCL